MLHPGTCKQDVPTALAIIHETTSAAIEDYFPERKDSAEFLRLFSKWWLISNAKNRFGPNRLGHAVVKGDNKPKFLRAMSDWIQSWTNEKIPGSEKFTLSPQTSAALIRTLRAQAQLIDDLLDDGYEFVLTARFQSDPQERRFGQYRQMSGGRFLVSLKDTEVSEKILKIMSLIKEGIDIDDNVKEEKCDDSLEHSLVEDPLVSDLLIDRMQLDAESRKIAVHVAGFVAKNLKENDKYSCCVKHLTGELRDDNPDHDYIRVLNRGGLTVPSDHFTEYVCCAFSILEHTESVITSSKLTTRRAATVVLKQVLNSNSGSIPQFACETHRSAIEIFTNRVLVNVFCNNRRKVITGLAKKDSVTGLKKSKRTKE